jgi:hypothetical protein
MRFIPLLFALLLAAPVSAAAQQTIRPGQTVTGELEEGDLEVDGVLYDVWRFRAPEDGPYLINLHSDDFDPLLQVGSRPGEEGCDDCQEDDDGGEGLNAQLVFPAQAGGRYLIRVRSYRADRGSYSLELEQMEITTDTVVTWDPGVVDTGVVTMDSAMVTMDTTVYTPVVPYPILVTGEAVRGTLDSDDAFVDGGNVDDYTYDAGAGETVTITLHSRDFDAFVTVGQTSYDGGWQPLGSDDDGGEGTNSRLTVTFPQYDRYTVRVRGFGGRVEGDYTLLLESHGAPEQPVSTDTVVGPVQAILYGAQVEGTLDGREDYTADGRYFDVYSFHGRAGETVTVSLQSADFDAYLFIAAARTGEKVATDDDGGTGTDSEVTFTLPETGEYLIRATSLMPDEQGEYVLHLVEGG